MDRKVRRDAGRRRLRNSTIDRRRKRRNLLLLARSPGWHGRNPGRTESLPLPQRLGHFVASFPNHEDYCPTGRLQQRPGRADPDLARWRTRRPPYERSADALQQQRIRGDVHVQSVHEKINCVSCMPNGEPPTGDVSGSLQGLLHDQRRPDLLLHARSALARRTRTKSKMSTSSSTGGRS